MYTLTRTIPPTAEPVSVDQAKTHCRIQGDDDDTYLETLIKAAREYAENSTNRAILQQTWRLSLGHFPRHGWGSMLRGYSADWAQRRFPLPPSIVLPRPNLIGIVSLTYLDTTGIRQTLDPSLYTVMSDGSSPEILPAANTTWPATLWGRPDAVQVTYTAGYGNTPAAVPAGVQLAILGLVAHWYENRESVVLTPSPNAVTTLPQFVDDLLEEHSVMRFTYEEQ